MEALKETMANMQRVMDEFSSESGVEHTGEMPAGNVDGCDSLTIRDGRLIVDIAPNRGVVAYLTNE